MKTLNTSRVLLLIFLLWSCNNDIQWDEVKLDSSISHDSIYKRMNKQEEIPNMFEFKNLDTVLIGKTSDVQYLVGNENADKYSKMNNCRAYFFKSDTLIINIGIGNGFGGRGFIIKYKANKFFTEPYYEDDVVFEGEPFETYKLIYQKLTLNKLNYKVGDSLFGKIDFKSIETDLEKKKHEHTGKGYFRAKVKQSPFYKS